MAVPVGPALQATTAAGIGQLKVSVSFLLLVGETEFDGGDRFTMNLDSGEELDDADED